MTSNGTPSLRILSLAPLLATGLLALPCASELSPAFSQERGVSSDEDTASEDLARDRHRLLHLADGRVLRRRARLLEGTWQVFEGRDWQALPSGSVARVLDERTVLAQARSMEAGLADDGTDAARRSALSDWMARQGLIEEAVLQLERILRAEPDNAAALGVIANLRPQLGLRAPADPADLLRSLSHSGPVARELLAMDAGSSLELGGVEALQLRAALGAELASHSHRTRESAAFALRKLFPGEAMGVESVRSLITRSVLDGSETVRAEACRALRDADDESVAGPAARALASRNAAVRENSIEALGIMAYPAAVPALVNHVAVLNAAAQSGSAPSGNPRGSIFIGKQTAYIQDFDVEVAQFQAVADPQINVLIEGSVLDARVIGTSVTRIASEGRMARRALRDITGEDPGDDNASWLDWWERNKHRWASSSNERPGRTSATPPSR